MRSLIQPASIKVAGSTQLVSNRLVEMVAKTSLGTISPRNSIFAMCMTGTPPLSATKPTSTLFGKMVNVSTLKVKTRLRVSLMLEFMTLVMLWTAPLTLTLAIWVIVMCHKLKIKIVIMCTKSVWPLALRSLVSPVAKLSGKQTTT